MNPEEMMVLNDPCAEQDILSPTEYDDLVSLSNECVANKNKLSLSPLFESLEESISLNEVDDELLKEDAERIFQIIYEGWFDDVVDRIKDTGKDLDSILNNRFGLSWVRDNLDENLLWMAAEAAILAASGGTAKLVIAVIWVIILILDIFEMVTGNYSGNWRKLKNETTFGMKSTTFYFLTHIIGLLTAGVAAKTLRGLAKLFKSSSEITLLTAKQLKVIKPLIPVLQDVSQKMPSVGDKIFKYSDKAKLWLPDSMVDDVIENSDKIINSSKSKLDDLISWLDKSIAKSQGRSLGKRAFAGALGGGIVLGIGGLIKVAHKFIAVQDTDISGLSAEDIERCKDAKSGQVTYKDNTYVCINLPDCTYAAFLSLPEGELPEGLDYVVNNVGVCKHPDPPHDEFPCGKFSDYPGLLDSIKKELAIPHEKIAGDDKEELDGIKEPIERSGDPYEYIVQNDTWMGRKKGSQKWLDISKYKDTVDILNKENPKAMAE